MMIFTESSLLLHKICILSLLIIYYLHNTDVRLVCDFIILQNTLIIVALYQPSFSSSKMLLREVELVFDYLVFECLLNSLVNLMVSIHLISVFLISLLLPLQGFF